MFFSDDFSLNKICFKNLIIHQKSIIPKFQNYLRLHTQYLQIQMVIVYRKTGSRHQRVLRFLMWKSKYH